MAATEIVKVEGIPREEETELTIVPIDVEQADKRAVAELELATRMSKRIIDVVKRADLAVQIRGSQQSHLKVEAWVTLARMMGLTPDIQECRYEERTTESGDRIYGYISIARLLDQNSRALSHSQAECWSDERNWARRDRFQLASMSQTRAISKSCRNSLAHIVVFAGFSGTPADEMTDDTIRGRLGEPEPAWETPAPTPQAPAPGLNGRGSKFAQIMSLCEDIGLTEQKLIKDIAKKSGNGTKINDMDEGQLKTLIGALKSHAEAGNEQDNDVFEGTEAEGSK